MKLSNFTKISAGAATVLVLLYFQAILLAPDVKIKIQGIDGMSITSWSTTIGNTTVLRTSNTITLKVDEIIEKELVIRADNYDEIAITFGSVGNTSISDIDIKLAASTSEDSDGSHQGIIKSADIQNLLWYNNTAILSNPRVRTDNNSRYYYTSQSALNPASIFFRKNISPPDILNLKIKKKKKNTQVDVYLDDGNKEN